jgi:hypothetical protein
VSRHLPDSLQFFPTRKLSNQPLPLLNTPQAKGKANYKVDALILVVEELLPNGAQGWQEVEPLYQHHSGELILWDHDDVKQHWIEKCCNKFKKPTGNPGDPKRDMLPRCQKIQQQIHTKLALVIMGVDSEGDEGFSDSDNDEESEKEEEEMIIGSRTNTPTVLVDGGLGIVAAEEVVIPALPPLVTQ